MSFKANLWKTILFVLLSAVIFLLLVFFISFPVLLVIDFTPLLFIIPDYWIITLPFIISLPLSYLITSFAQKKMIKDLRTRIMSRRLFGVVLVLFQVWAFASNMIQGYIEIANAIGIICGLVFIFNNPKTAKNIEKQTT